MLVRTSIFLLLLTAGSDVFSQTLIPFRKKNGNFIYVDSLTMKPVITREFHDARFFENGVAYAKINEDDKFIMIDRKGNTAKAGKYEINSPYDENGFATFNDGELEGVVDRNGKVIVPAIYNYASRFYDNRLALVGQDGVYGYVDRNGNLIVAPQFESWDFFSEGIVFMKEKGDQGDGMFGTNGKWGAINEQGNQVLPFIYDSRSEFKNGLALIQKDNNFILIDKKGVQQKLPGDYQIVGTFSNGFAEVTKNGKVGFINEKYEVAVPLIYDTIDMMNINGRAAVALNGKWGLVDRQGKLVVPCQYEKIEAFNGKSITEFTLSGKKGVLHMDGKVIVPAIYDDLVINDGEFVFINRNGNWGVMNSQGKVLIQPSEKEASLWDMMMAHSHGNTFMFMGVYRTAEGKVYSE